MEPKQGGGGGAFKMLTPEEAANAKAAAAIGGARLFEQTFRGNLVNYIAFEPGQDGRTAVMRDWINMFAEHARTRRQVALISQRLRESAKEWVTAQAMVGAAESLLQFKQNEEKEKFEIEYKAKALKSSQEAYEYKREFDNRPPLPEVAILKAAEDAVEVCAEVKEDLFFAENEAKRVEAITKRRVCEEHRSTVGLGEQFPNIQVGMALANIEATSVSKKGEQRTTTTHFYGRLFPDIVKLITGLPTPHTVRFVRYNFRQHSMHRDIWFSFEELSASGKHVPDKMIEIGGFVDATREQDMIDMQQKMDTGLDPTTRDVVGATALHYAAGSSVNRQKAMDWLLSLEDDPHVDGVDINATDTNLQTPLEWAVQAGDEKSACYLEGRVGRKETQMLRDWQGKGVLRKCVDIGHMPLASFFVRRGADVHCIDARWGWSLLHVAAHTGSLDFTRYFLEEHKLNMHALSRAGHTPLDVSRLNHQAATTEFLAAKFAAEPAHAVFVTPGGAELWVGTLEASHEEWARKRGFLSIVTVIGSRSGWMECVGANGEVDQLPEELAWLDKAQQRPESVKSRRKSSLDNPLVALMVAKEAEDHEAENVIVEHHLVVNKSLNRHGWKTLLPYLKELIDFLHESLQAAEGAENFASHEGNLKGRILLACDSGDDSFVATAITVAYLVCRRRARIVNALEHITRARPQLELTENMRQGLEHLEEEFDARKEERRRRQLRESIICSIAFA